MAPLGKVVEVNAIKVSLWKRIRPRTKEISGTPKRKEILARLHLAELLNSISMKDTPRYIAPKLGGIKVKLMLILMLDQLLLTTHSKIESIHLIQAMMN